MNGWVPRVQDVDQFPYEFRPEHRTPREPVVRDVSKELVEEQRV